MPRAMRARVDAEATIDAAAQVVTEAVAAKEAAGQVAEDYPPAA